jgi:hypothetical protein
MPDRNTEGAIDGRFGGYGFLPGVNEVTSRAQESSDVCRSLGEAAGTLEHQMEKDLSLPSWGEVFTEQGRDFGEAGMLVQGFSFGRAILSQAE